MLAGIASTVWLARILGPDGFGLLGFGAAVLTYFAVAANMGTDALAAREIARAPDDVIAVTGATLGLRLGLAALAYAVFVATVFVVRDDHLGRVVLLTQGGVLFATAITADFMFQGLERMGVNALRQSAQAFLILIGAVALVASPDDITFAAALTPVAGAIAALAVLFWARRSYAGLAPTFRASAWPSRLKASAPFALMTLMHTVLLSFDVVMIGVILDDAAVGIYSAALKLAMLVMIPSGMLMSAWYPVLARRFGDTAEMQREGDTFARFALSFGVPFALIGAVFAPAAVTGLFGPAYGDAGRIAVVLMAVSGLIHLHVAFGAPLAAWNRERAHAWIYVLGAGVNIAANAALIPKYGGMGAALASMLSYAVIVVASAVIYRQAAEALPWRAVTAAAAAAMLTLPLALGIAMGIAGRMPPIWEAILGSLVAFSGFLIVARVTRLLPAAAWDFVADRFRRGA